MTLKIEGDELNSINITEEELILEIAILLYAKGKLSMGKASKMANMNRILFQNELGKRQIPVNYDEKELEVDLNNIPFQQDLDKRKIEHQNQIDKFKSNLSNLSDISDKILNNSIFIFNEIFAQYPSLINDFDFFKRDYGTTSFEFENEETDNEYYLHIEIGKTLCNWQYRVNGKRISQDENIPLDFPNNKNMERIISALKAYEEGLNSKSLSPT